MAGKYNTWLRAKLADRIRDNGGYSRGYHTSLALVWMVRYYSTGIDDAEDAAKALVEHEYFLNEAHLILALPDFDDWFRREISVDRAYEYSRDSLQEDLANDDGFKMWSSATAAKYGFDYKGRGADSTFDMELSCWSSGGKRVALETFEGENLKVDCSDLAGMIGGHLEIQDTDDGRYSNEWCRKLMGIMDELDQSLTEENANRCGRYYATDYIARELGIFD